MSERNVNTVEDEFVEDVDDRRRWAGFSVNRLCVYAVWCVLSFDYMATFLASLPWWQLLGGDFALYGLLVLGLYGLVSAVGAPLGGVAADRFGNKLVICLGVASVLLGQLLWYLSGVSYYRAYTDLRPLANLTLGANSSSTSDGDDAALLAAAAAALQQGRGLVIASRVLGGLGSGAGLVVALRHLVASAPAGQQLQVMNSTRVAAIVARIVGPTLGSIFLFTPTSHWGRAVMNFSTWPAFVAMLLELLVLVAFALCFRSAAGGTGNQWNWRLWQDATVAHNRGGLAVVLTVVTLSMTSMWIVYSQLIPISAFVYQSVSNINTLWRVYLPLIVGAFAYSLIVARLFDRLQLGLPSQVLLLLVLLVAGNVGLFPFALHPSPWLFYAAGTLFFLGNSGVQTILRAVYARLCAPSPHLGVLLSVLWIANGVAQFVGSAISTAIVAPQISNAWLRQHNCSTDYHNNPDYTCSACTVTTAQLVDAVHSDDGSQLAFGCYYLQNYVVLMAISTAVAVFCGLATLFSLPRLDFGHKNYESLDDINEESHLIQN